MSKLQRRIYRALLWLHPASFRNEFGRDMVRDCEDAIRERGFAALLGDAFFSLARQWKERALTGPELAMKMEPAIEGHPFLSGQYVTIDRGTSVTAFDLARASILSALLVLIIGFAASVPNRHVIANTQSARVSHDGGIDTGGGSSRSATNQARRERFGAQPLLSTTGNANGVPFHGRVRLVPGSEVGGWGVRAKHGPQAMGTLANVVRQLILVTLVLWLTSFFVFRSTGIVRRVVLSMLGLLGIAASVALASVPKPPMHAQIVHASGPLPSFEVATVKPTDPKVMVRITPPGSQNVVRSAGTARLLIALAYNLGGTATQRVVGGPDWINDQIISYVIEGKIPEDHYAQMQTMTAAMRHDEAILMMQSLLADRFKLKVHFEMREMPIYELSIAKGGPKLPTPNDASPHAPTPGSADPPRPPQMGGGEVLDKDGLRIRNMTLDGMLTAPWFGLGGRPIVNKTGLTGTYDLKLHDWQPELPAQAPNGLAPPPEGQASIFTVLQEQLGLKLTPSKASMEVVVIDSIEKPSEN